MKLGRGKGSRQSCHLVALRELCLSHTTECIFYGLNHLIYWAKHSSQVVLSASVTSKDQCFSLETQSIYRDLEDKGLSIHSSYGWLTWYKVRRQNSCFCCEWGIIRYRSSMNQYILVKVSDIEKRLIFKVAIVSSFK